MRTTTIAIRESTKRRRTDATPWYRQFWPWFLIALPAASVALSFLTLYAALRDGDAVVPHEGDSTSYSAPREPATPESEAAFAPPTDDFPEHDGDAP